MGSSRFPETEEHAAPRLDAEARGEPALIVAFPAARALPLPPPGSVVGREWLLSLGMDDAKVSREHFSISRAGGQFQVTDVGSRNGTWLDGHQLTAQARAPLRDGAILRIGRTLCVFRAELAGGMEPTPPIGGLVGPYGQRHVSAAVQGFVRRPPRNVLIEGETGTGKELVAAAIAATLRPGKPYAPINVAGVAAGVFDSQFFGYVAGAYSGSGRGSPGIVARHEGGTVFLDELGELPLELQPKLLRLLDNREVLPVGADRPQQVDVLVVAATNRPLDAMVAAGAFRQDLLARFAPATIELTPLRERPEDIFEILTALVRRSGDAQDPAQVEVEAVERLLLHDFPANVRELEAIFARMAALEAPPAFRLSTLLRVLPPASTRLGPLTPERAQAALAEAQGNRSVAARALGVSRGQLLRFLKSNGLA